MIVSYTGLAGSGKTYHMTRIALALIQRSEIVFSRHELEGAYPLVGGVLWITLFLRNMVYGNCAAEAGASLLMTRYHRLPCSAFVTQDEKGK
jgi:hypothetical protein